jgi:hypothetical protein
MNFNSLQEKYLTDNEKKEVKAFLLGEPIIKLQSGVIKANHEGTAIKNARKWAELNKQIIFRGDIGNVIFNGKGVKDSLSHGFAQRKLDAIQAIPQAIKNGKIVKISPDNKGKPQKNIIILAPVQIENEISVIAIRLVKNISDEIRFYIHEVLDIKKGNTIRPSAHELTANPQGGTAPYLNILFDIWNVNEKNVTHRAWHRKSRVAPA